MNYSVLARKWRPDTFAQVIGQDVIVRSLTNSLRNNHLHHAYLFSGMRGVGKTSLARILAKCLNCEDRITATACNNCANCRAIKKGTFIDLLEVDAASRTKVEDTRDLLENISYAPSIGRFKIYLIDEVHMLSNHSFNALLKTLEEPPEHVKFLLATTEVQKIPPTILSRCIQLHVQHISTNDMVKQLHTILEAEKISYAEGSLEQISRMASGSMRDALSITDQVISFCNGNITTEAVSNILGIVDLNHTYKLVELIIAGNTQKLWQHQQKLFALHFDGKQLLADIMMILQQIATAQILDNYTDTLSQYQSVIKKLAQVTTPEQIQLLYQIALLSNRDLYLAPNIEQALQMIFLRMLTFTPINHLSVTEPIVSLPQNPAKNNNDKLAEQPKTQKINTNIAQQQEKQEKLQPLNNNPSPASPNTQVNTDPLQFDSTEDTAKHWKNTIDKLKLSGVTKVLIMQTSIVKQDTNNLHLCMQNATYKLWNDKHTARLQESLNHYYGHDIKIKINLAEEIVTPLNIVKQEQKIQQQKLLSIIENDSNIDYIKKKFNATVESYEQI